MENISLKYVYNKNKRASDTKPQPLYVEVRINKTNKAVYINTGIKLYPDQFSNKNGFTCKNHDKASLITKKAMDVFNKVYEFAVSEECNSLEQVKNYNTEMESTESVIDFMEDVLRRNNATLSVIQHHLLKRMKQVREF